jgi:hypothetical protein
VFAQFTFEVEFVQRMILQFAMYFSIVRRSACCASLVSRSTSVKTTTLKLWPSLFATPPPDDVVSAI